MKTRILASLLIISLALSAFCLFGCSGGDKSSPGDNTREPGETLPGGEDTPEPDPGIMVLDMNGKEFTIIASGWWDVPSLEVPDICPEEYNGEPLNDAAYNRKIKIEETYNCKIKQIPGSYGPEEDMAKLQKSVQAGDHTYDVAMMRGINFTGLLTKNYLLELGELQNIDFDNHWWRKQCSDALRIGGKRYGVSGNLSTREISLAALVCFNKKLVENYGLESPYELVKSGDWTLDRLAGMSKQITRDLDGDGKLTEADLWGISYDRDRVWNLLNSCGVRMIELDADGYPQITIDSEANISKAQNVLIKLFDESYAANGRRIPVGFHTERVLFSLSWALSVVELREQDFEFGIIPFPKYDREQSEYMPNIYGLGLNIICVPSTNTDMENTGMFLEALSYEGQKTIIPVYYENILKTKSARDDESEDMLDYIFDNLRYDTGTLLNFNNFTQTICELAETQNTNIASFVEKNKPRVEKEIKKIMDTISEG